MAELDEKLNALLSDPNSMAQIMQMAQQLSATMGGGSASPSPPTAAAPPAAPTTQTAPQTPAPSLPGGIDPQVVARFLPLLQEYSRSSSQTMQLLYALRPFLKESKQDKVERAARLEADIAITSAETARTLVGCEPRIAMLSFSTTQCGLESFTSRAVRTSRASSGLRCTINQGSMAMQ